MVTTAVRRNPLKKKKQPSAPTPTNSIPETLSINIPPSLNINMALFRDLFEGVDTMVPVLNGGERTYTNLDNGASTPAFKVVADAVKEFLPYYSSVHRGSGFKSQLSTWLFEECRHAVLDFVGAGREEHYCIFGKNATEAVNKLARRFPFTEDRDLVLVSGMEHHSSDLPWRAFAPKMVHVDVLPDGSLDMAHFDDKLARFAHRVALVSITGASNVTGIINPIHEIAVKAHAVGAQIYVDCAQLIAHRKINMLPLSDPAHLDFISLSGHKMYAPYGTGALVGRSDVFAKGVPDMPGGGTVQVVTRNKIMWANGPDRDEAGSPNTIGALALFAAIRKLTEIGMDNVARHEADLTSYALRRLSTIPGITLYGNTKAEQSFDRVGVIPFSLSHIPYAKVAAILGNEFGIGVRAGCFCAQPYILSLTGRKEEDALVVMENLKMGDHTTKPGLVRASFGLYNTSNDVDSLFYALQMISENRYKGIYEQNVETGEYEPKGWRMEFEKYFSLDKVFAGSSKSSFAVALAAEGGSAAMSGGLKSNDANVHDRLDSAYHSSSRETSGQSLLPLVVGDDVRVEVIHSREVNHTPKLDGARRSSLDSSIVSSSISSKKGANRATISHPMDWKSYKIQAEAAAPGSPARSTLSSMCTLIGEMNDTSSLEQSLIDTDDGRKDNIEDDVDNIEHGKHPKATRKLKHQSSISSLKSWITTSKADLESPTQTPSSKQPHYTPARLPQTCTCNHHHLPVSVSSRPSLKFRLFGRK